MLIAIPSKGRPDRIKSQEYIRSAAVFVPEQEEAVYQAFGVKNVVPVPSYVRGITLTRNWILDFALEREEQWVVFIDDDLKVAGYIELFHDYGRHRPLSGEEMIGEWVKLFDVTEAMRYRIWGIATDGALRSVYPWKPFLWHTYITASCMGIINDGRTRFDPDFPVKEDYELCLRCIQEDGGIVGARYLYWVNSRWTDRGGCADYRTQEMEERAIKELIRRYPRLIRRVTRGGSKYSIELDF